MGTVIDKLTADGCATDDRHKVCRSRGGESCAFDGAMIVLQPIADAAHVVHGPIACCGNSWEGRGTKSSRGLLHTMGFTTDMSEIDIIYGAEDKLLAAVRQTVESVRPRAVFVYATCVSGLIGEDIEAVCRKAEAELGTRVIPVSAPGFVGPKNLGNRIAGEVLLEHVIGTAEPPVRTPTDINLIGEYNIAGDFWQIEPLLAKAGIRIMARITGDATFEEITWAHRARLNVVVCGRALINVARTMEQRYGIPYTEVSFFGRTEIAKALRAIAEKLQTSGVGRHESGDPGIRQRVEQLITDEEKKLQESVKPYRHLRGRKAVLYSGGVKSWSLISALRDLGIEIVAIGTKKSTFEDEEKMKELLGPGAPLVEDVSPKNLLRLLQERGADMLIAGGRNQYLAVKEGYPFVDVNQERHTAYAGYAGLVNLAEQIHQGLRFYGRSQTADVRSREPGGEQRRKRRRLPEVRTQRPELLVNPLKHSPALGAALAFQGIHNALPIIHGAQGCGFLAKALLTKHFREPIALATSKLFVEDVVMGSEENLRRVVEGVIDNNRPDVIGVLTSGLSEVKGDDVAAIVRSLAARGRSTSTGQTTVVQVATPDYGGGLEVGYARAVEAMIRLCADGGARTADRRSVTVLAGSHLTPADVTELREILESFGLRPIILPDLSALDGSRRGMSALSAGGTTVADMHRIPGAAFTLAVGTSMAPAAQLLTERFGIEHQVFDSLAGIEAVDSLIGALARITGTPVPARIERQRAVLVDGLRDAHFFLSGRKACIALEPDHAVQVSQVLDEAGAEVALAVVPTLSDAAERIRARDVVIGDLGAIRETFDLLISTSHAEGTARQLGVPLYQTGFPVYKIIGNTHRVTIGYRGTLTMVNEIANLMMKRH